MLSISYEEIFSRFYTKVEAYDLMTLYNDVTMQNVTLCSWLHSAISAPYVYRLFSTITLPKEDNIDGYYIVRDNDFVYNPRISNLAPVGPINRNKLGRTGVMSPLYTVFKTHDV